MFQFLQPTRNGIEFSSGVGAVGSFNRTVLFAPLVQGALGYMQLLTQGFDEFSLFITANGLNFEFSGVSSWHSLDSFVSNETSLLRKVLLETNSGDFTKDSNKYTEASRYAG